MAVALIKRLMALGDDINYVNAFGSLFHILISRSSFSSTLRDPVAVACFDFLLSVQGRDCDQFVATNGMGTPLSLSFKLNQMLFAERLLKQGFVALDKCNLEEFRFTSDSVLALKVLYFSGFSFTPSNFGDRNRPRNADDIEMSRSFEEFRAWLKNQNPVQSLQNITRIWIRNHFKTDMVKILSTINFPPLLVKFLMFEDVNDCL
jgi:hypothetical protein